MRWTEESQIIPRYCWKQATHPLRDIQSSSKWNSVGYPMMILKSGSQKFGINQLADKTQCNAGIENWGHLESTCGVGSPPPWGVQSSKGKPTNSSQ